MIRITKMSGKYYGREIDIDDEDDVDDIKAFVSETTPCILVDDLEDLDSLGIDENDIIMVG